MKRRESGRHHMAYWIALWGGAGLMRPAPGSWGSFAALFFAYIMFLYLPIWAFLLAIAAVFGLGHWACAVYNEQSGKQDASEIVVDEVVGQWIALIPVLLLRPQSWIAFAIAFVFFRIFDILKPWPVSWADKRHDALGIMLDDVIAGALAAILSWGILTYVPF